MWTTCNRNLPNVEIINRRTHPHSIYKISISHPVLYSSPKNSTYKFSQPLSSGIFLFVAGHYEILNRSQIIHARFASPYLEKKKKKIKKTTQSQVRGIFT